MSRRYDREPCPWRVIEDSGGAYAFGLTVGTIWNIGSGIRNAPKGQVLREALLRVKARSPILGGSFAIWGVLFACFDCSISHVRKKEDIWNPILSGAATGGLLAARSGFKNMARNAVVGGVILAAIEGLSIALTRYAIPYWEQRQLKSAMPIDPLDPPVDPLRKRYELNMQ